MIRIGKYNNLTISELSSPGAYLTDGSNKVLLPNRYVPDNAEPGQEMRVFVYTDSEDRPVATTDKPKAVADSFATLKVVAISQFGAFLDWGLEKDLLMPHREQNHKVKEGETVVVRVVEDPRTNRVIATAKLDPFLSLDPGELKEDQMVKAQVFEVTELGYRTVVNKRFSGLLYENEVFRPLFVGDVVQAYVRKFRRDGKIDLNLQPRGYAAVELEQEEVWRKLENAGGFLPFHDKTDPETIKNVFGLSKKQFKKILGALYKEGRIILLPDGFRRA